MSLDFIISVYCLDLIQLIQQVLILPKTNIHLKNRKFNFKIITLRYFTLGNFFVLVNLMSHVRITLLRM